MFNISFAGDESFSVEFSETESMTAEFDKFIEVPVVDYYDGDYVFTPSAQEQTVPIRGKTARRNITINPIPSNYGLITWNGAVLTVS